MANPQKENGYTAIANELLEKIYEVDLTIGELRTCLFVIRKTYGFHKKLDKISLTQFERNLSISRPGVCKILKRLVTNNILKKQDGKYGINKNYEEWVVNGGLLGGSKLLDNGVVNGGLPTKETITKEILISAKAEGDLSTNKKPMYDYQPIDDDGNPIKVTKRGKRSINPNPYDFPTELKRLKNAPQKQYKIVAHYWVVKGFEFANRDQHESALGRDVVSAKKLVGYSGEQIQETMDYCQSKWPNDWRLETVVNWITR